MRGAWRRFRKSLAWGGGRDRVSRKGLASALARLRQERLRIYGQEASFLEPFSDDEAKQTHYMRPVSGWLCNDR